MVVRCLTIALFCLLSLSVSADTLKVAVAANFKPLLNQLKSDFESRHSIKLSLSSASTGVLYAQIRHGAPFDVFLSADGERPRRLEKQNLIVEGSRVTYATGQLVLWHEELKPTASFLQSWRGKIAIANPKTAPYGLAAKSVLEHLQLWQGKRRQLVSGNNIAQAYQFVQTGNAKLGFVALSQVIEQGNDNYWLLPIHWYEAIEQQMVILQSSRNLQQARLFATWLMSTQIQQRINKAGYLTHAER